MSLTPGARIGPYEIVAAIGAGGMGEVYRARDAKLNRPVALKVLPDHLAGDPDRLARFRREAQMLAALNHPNIGHIYGFEDSGATHALVLELIEGPTLADRIAQGPIALAEALPIARQLAEALDAAHEQGIIHRDLKPANIKVRADGTVKVLDFGLAKALDSGGAASAFDATASPTVTAAATERGVILGTVAYMAPEQARGTVVDKRADIWAFGVVLYEMLTGARAFTGQEFSDVLAAVLRQEIDWTKLPPRTPRRVRELLERCLERDVKQRLRDIGEARVAIATVEREGPGTTSDAHATAHPRPRRRERLAWSLAALAILAAAALASFQRVGLGPASSPAGTDLVRLSVLPPPGLVMNPDSANVAISPDGRMVAFTVGSAVSTENQLWVRALDTPVARRIEAGDGASLPFWSPDSQRIGFFAARKLKTVAAAGGAPADVVCDAPFGRGGAWNSSNIIVFAPDANGPLYRVSSNGGDPTPVTTLDASRHESGHRFPVFLPDQDHFLFAALPERNGAYAIFAGSLSDVHARTLIGSMESAPVYASPASSGRADGGWLLFTRQGVLAAQPFDAKALRTTGEAASLGDQPTVAPSPAAFGAGHRVSVSTVGSLAYFLEPRGNTSVLWLDGAGKTTGAVNVPPGQYSAVAIAPDGARAVLVRSDSPTTSSLWLVDLTRESAVPLSTGGGQNASPTWSPDSTRIVFTSDRDGQSALFEKTVADSSPERRISRLDLFSTVLNTWSPDGAWIVLSAINPDTKWNVYRLPASGSGTPVPIVNGPGIEVGGSLSPGGHWLAYLSDEAGRLDLFVQSFPEPGPRVQISTGGALLSWWTRDERRLLFLDRQHTLWHVDVDLRATPPRIGTPQEVAAFSSNLVAMAPAPDRQRFLALVSEHAGLGAVTVVQSWRAALPASR